MSTARLQMDTAMHLANELGLVAQLYSGRLAALLRKHDITYPQFVILEHILRMGKDGQTIDQISDAVEVLQPAVTKTVKKFENLGLVRHKKGSADRRQKHVEITDEGAGFIGRLQASLLPDILECFEDWEEEKLTRFADELAIFREWLEHNRIRQASY